MWGLLTAGCQNLSRKRVRKASRVYNLGRSVRAQGESGRGPLGVESQCGEDSLSIVNKRFTRA